MPDEKTTVSATTCAASNVSQQTVPVKIDGSALAGMMNKIAAAQQQAAVEYVSPAAYVQQAGERLQDMYARYELLRKLGGALHGKSLTAELAPDVQIEQVTIKFKLPTATEALEAKIFNVAFVGDIAPLLSTEMGTIILALQQEAKALTELSQATEEAAKKARDAWEASNKDRKIAPADASDVTPLSGEILPANEN